MVTLNSVGWGTARLFSQGLHHFMLPPAVDQGSSSCTSSPTHVINCVLDYSHPCGCEVVSQCSLNYVFPMANCGKFWKRWEYQTTWPASWEICMQVKKQQLELDMEQWTGSKLGKEYVKAVYCHPAYLTYMQSVSCECQARWSTCWNQSCWEKYQQPQICRWHHPNDRKRRGREELLMKVKEESEKAGLKLNI